MQIRRFAFYCEVQLVCQDVDNAVKGLGYIKGPTTR